MNPPALMAVRRFGVALTMLAAGCSVSADALETNMPDSPSPLAGAEMVGFLATTDAARCRAFFVDQLRFRVSAEDGLAITLDVGGSPIRIQKLREHRPQQFTVLGWNVTDLDAVVERLAAVGVHPQHYGFSMQDERGVAAFADGTRLIWLHDPDGNILSVAQMPPR